MDYDFDRLIDRRGTHAAKWDKMETVYGVSPRDGIAMWVADMDFTAAPPIQRALDEMRRVGVYGYYGDDESYLAAIEWWMRHRHGWKVRPEWVFTTHGLVHGTAMCVDAFTEPGDGVVLMSPVYHAFSRVIRAAGREVVDCPLALEHGRYHMDFERWDAQMTGREKMLILCSPHNPGGRVWTREELEGVADFARRHDLVLVSDEIHHDLVFGPARHLPMAMIEGIEDRLVMMTATSKTFNIAGAHNGNVIIQDPDLRARFAARMAAMGISPNAFGMIMSEAAYTPEGARWVDALMSYLEGNRDVIDAGLNSIPGVRSMKMEATYLAWVDFSGTGMTREEFTRRVEQDAKVAVNHGTTFGPGGEDFLRFNFATPRSRVIDAVQRLRLAFRDL